MARKLAAEALGSALLFATVIGSGIMAAALAGGNDAVALLGNTLATVAMLFVLITMLGPVSGAQFNPAVTLVMALRRDLAWRDAGLYVLAQLGGGFVGVLLSHAMFDLPLLQLATKVRTGPGQWLAEGVASFALLLTILGTLRHRPAWLPVSVAAVITAGYWFTASTSFANPAITLARTLTDSFAGIRPADAPAFIAAQLAGALLAMLVGGWLFGAE
ncbi:MAG: aquaporin family protein [Alphaproteobacteria bacterium PA4]|nr:MAG: aquaporin family protein [Alphaproteobacteria bacterium PA4]